MADEVKVPDTQDFRVVVVGVLYDSPRLDHDLEGNPKVIYVRQTAGRGQVIGLVPREAKRLGDLSAVRPAEDPKGYDELDDAEAKSAAAARGLVVRSSGADADQPLREDFITALVNADRSELTGVGVGTTPGGIMAASASGATRVDVPTPPPPGDEPLDVLGAPGEHVMAHIHDGNLNAADTVALADGDPEKAKKVLAAETALRSGDPRATVEGPLQKIIEG